MHAISDEALADIQNDVWRQVNGRLWRHRNGTAYQIVDVALRESDHTPLVIYRSVKPSGVTWARPASEFLDGRFTVIEEPCS